MLLFCHVPVNLSPDMLWWLRLIIRSKMVIYDLLSSTPLFIQQKWASAPVSLAHCSQVGNRSACKSTDPINATPSWIKGSPGSWSCSGGSKPLFGKYSNALMEDWKMDIRVGSEKALLPVCFLFLNRTYPTSAIVRIQTVPRAACRAMLDTSDNTFEDGRKGLNPLCLDGCKDYNL